VYVGGGGGFLYMLSSEFALNVGANLVAGFPRVTGHMDINLGIAYQF
jgi:hypothetical protein